MRLPKLARRGWLLAVEVLLLGVGMVAALLSLSAARAALSTALRVPNPGRTYFLGRGSDPIPEASYQDILSWGERRSILTRVGAFGVWGPIRVESQSQSLDVEAGRIKKDMLAFLPGRVDAGRPLTDADFAPAPRGAVVNVLVSERLQGQLGPGSAVGAVLQSFWGTFRVVGVFPGWARFPNPDQPDIIIPFSPTYTDTGSYEALGELRKGLTREQAERALNLAPQTGSRSKREPVRLVSMQASLDPGAARVSEYGLALGLLTLLLLMATAALIELLDSIRGKRERSIKLALGATQDRLALERTLEVFVICILAVAVGGLLVVAGRPWFAQAWGTDWVTVPHVDGFTLAALGALLFSCCLVVSIAPALIARATRAYAALKEERASTSRTVQRSRMAIIALQVAVSIAFAFGAAKLASGLHALATEPLGINVANVWDGSAQFSSPLGIMEGAAQSGQQARQDGAFRELLRARLLSLPGVAEVGFASEGPAAGSHGIATSELAPRGERPSPGNSVNSAPATAVDSDYLQMLGCRLLAGRYFTPAEELQPPSEFFNGGPVILSAPLARKLFGETNAVGRDIGYFALVGPMKGKPIGGFNKVVGVVSGMRTFGLRAPITDEVFQPLTGAPIHLALRMKGSAGISLTEVQQAVSDVFPWIRIGNFEPLRQRFDSELAVPRQRLGLLAFFAAISAAVAALGLASVLLVIIKERDLEIGIRRALGASDRDLTTALLRQLVPWIAAGLAVGFALPTLFPAPLGIAVTPSRAAALWSGTLAIATMLMLIAASLWLPLRRAFRRPISDLLRTE